VEPYEEYLALGTALAVGLLIGLEREQTRPAKELLFGGVRTYPIFALIGAVSTMLEPAAMWMPLVALAGVITLLAISYADAVRQHHEHGVTTEASVIATFLLGALAASRGAVEPMSTRLLLVAGLGVIVTFLLSSKQVLHSIASRVSREDFYATVKFLIVAAIVLPLLPHRAIGPLAAIDPFDVGLMIVTISGLSFVGYVAIRLLGQRRGLLASAALGGLVSSTAVTISFANRAKQNAALVPAAAGAIAIASTIMIGRVAVLVALVAPPVLRDLAIPLTAMAIGAVIAGLLVSRQHGAASDGEITLKNPFELSSAIRFGLLFAVILIATKAAQTYFGGRGLFIASGVGGLTDVDAVTLSTSKLTRAGVDTDTAMRAILIGIAANTIVKSSLALALGGRQLGKRAFVVGGMIIVGGIGGLAITLA
jgi:uncharacterized membrane protein (DUF4010 family)